MQKKAMSDPASGLRELAPGLEYRPVTLRRGAAPALPMRCLYTLALFLVSLPFLQTPLFGMDQAASRAKAKCEARLGRAQREDGGTPALKPCPALQGPDFFLAGHTNSPHTNVAGVNRPHTNVHTNSAERHVNVNSEPAHCNMTRPHSNSHMDSPHVNSSHQNVAHTNVNTPSTGKEGA